MGISDFISGTIFPEHITEEERKKINTIIKTAVPIIKPVTAGLNKIFISLCEREENIVLVEQILDPFLTTLSFDVYYWWKNKRYGPPAKTIYSIMDNCDGIIGLYTNDQKLTDGSFRPAGNVILEMGREKPRYKIILCEKGTMIETMTYSSVNTIRFTRDKYGKLILDLLTFLRNSNWVDITASIQ